MKKTIVFLTALTLALVLAACGTEPEEDVEKTEGYVSPTDMETAEPEPAPLPQEEAGIGVYHGSGGGPVRLRIEYADDLRDDMSPEGLVFYSDLTPDFPVFIDPFPNGRDGPLYEITEEMIALVPERLSAFMRLLYRDFDPEKYPFAWLDFAPTNPILEYRGEDLTVWCMALGNISVEAPEDDILPLLPDGDLRQSPLLAAFLDYLDISDWQVEYTVDYDTYGRPYWYYYRVYQKAADSGQALLNRQFGAIVISYSPGLDHISVFACDPALQGEEQHVRVDPPLPTISLEQALDEVKKLVPELDRRTVKVDMRYFAGDREGYLVPCWQLYMPQKDQIAADGSTLYYTVWVPMADTSALE